MITTRPSASAIAAWAAATVSHTVARAVGTPAVCITVLANAFELSSRAAAAEGPKHGDAGLGHPVGEPGRERRLGADDDEVGARPAASSVIPSRSVTATAWSVASRPMPGFPGAACSSASRGDCASFHASACSRPPDPTRSTRMRSSLHAVRGRHRRYSSTRDEVHGDVRPAANAVRLLRPDEVADERRGGGRIP